MLVTPELVHGIDPGDVTSVPGEKWRNPDMWTMLVRGDLGEEIPDPAASRPGSPGAAPVSYQGAAGFTPPPVPASK